MQFQISRRPLDWVYGLLSVGVGLKLLYSDFLFVKAFYYADLKIKSAYVIFFYAKAIVCEVSFLIFGFVFIMFSRSIFIVYFGVFAWTMYFVIYLYFLYCKGMLVPALILFLPVYLIIIYLAKTNISYRRSLVK